MPRPGSTTMCSIRRRLSSSERKPRQKPSSTSALLRICAVRVRASPVFGRLRDLLVKPRDHPLELRNLQRLRALLGCRMQRGDALEHLPDMRCFGRIGKALYLMPLGKRREPRVQCVHREGLRVVGKVPCDRVGAGRKETAPFDLEMPDRGLIAAPRVLTRGGLDVAFNGVGGQGDRLRTHQISA
jgi:hypothetical protein